MIVETARFGSVEVDEDKVILFEDGLPGFESLTKYIILSPPEPNPFHSPIRRGQGYSANHC